MKVTFCFKVFLLSYKMEQIHSLCHFKFITGRNAMALLGTSSGASRLKIPQTLKQNSVTEKPVPHPVKQKKKKKKKKLSKLYFMQENIDRLFLFQPSKTTPSSTLCTIDNDNICVGSERAATTHICNTRKKGNNIK